MELLGVRRHGEGHIHIGAESWNTIRNDSLRAEDTPSSPSPEDAVKIREDLERRGLNRHDASSPHRRLPSRQSGLDVVRPQPVVDDLSNHEAFECSVAGLRHTLRVSAAAGQVDDVSLRPAKHGDHDPPDPPEKRQTI